MGECPIGLRTQPQQREHRTQQEQRQRQTLRGDPGAVTLDEKGLARVEGIDKGMCKVSFPDLDKEAWEEA